MLTIVPGQDIPKTDGSSKKIIFQCSCGNIHKTRWCHYKFGTATTCGRCVIKSINERIKIEKFGKLKVKIGQHAKSTAQKLIWVCDCGNEKLITLNSILRGLTRSCTECNKIDLHYGTRFGKLRYIGTNQKVFIGGTSKYPFECECGNSVFCPLARVSRGQKTCGHCGVKPAEWWSAKKFGRLRIKNPLSIYISSDKKVEFCCDCGNTKLIKINHVTSGRTKSCNDCRSVVYNWYTTNRAILQSGVLPDGGISALEVIKNTVTPFMATCPVCQSIYYPRISDIKRGVSLTCGCSKNKISAPNKEIAEFVRSLGFDYELEFPIQNKYFDIFVPSANLLIEFNGLKWHSLVMSKLRDIKKYRIAIKHGYNLVSIFEDEWIYKKEIMKNILSSRLKVPGYTAVRPKSCSIELISYSDAKSIYDSYHYIGSCSARWHYGIIYGGAIVGAMSFRVPVRQNCKSQYEIARMVLNPKYKIYGIWSKILKKFILDLKPFSIISFSDNRFFTGSVYEKLGFKLDKEIKSDYYWVKGTKRFHKSSLRKRPGENGTETKLRLLEGYSKIWDLGKKRWILNL